MDKWQEGRIGDVPTQRAVRAANVMSFMMRMLKMKKEDQGSEEKKWCVSINSASEDGKFVERERSGCWVSGIGDEDQPEERRGGNMGARERASIIYQSRCFQCIAHPRAWQRPPIAAFGSAIGTATNSQHRQQRHLLGAYRMWSCALFVWRSKG
jgi:hypothetical protein